METRPGGNPSHANRRFLHIPIFDAGPRAASDGVPAGRILLRAEQRPQQIFRIGSLGKPENQFGAGKHCCSKPFRNNGSNTTRVAAVTMTTIVGCPIGQRRERSFGIQLKAEA